MASPTPSELRWSHVSFRQAPAGQTKNSAEPQHDCHLLPQYSIEVWLFLLRRSLLENAISEDTRGAKLARSPFEQAKRLRLTIPIMTIRTPCMIHMVRWQAQMAAGGCGSALAPAQAQSNGQCGCYKCARAAILGQTLLCANTPKLLDRSLPSSQYLVQQQSRRHRNGSDDQVTQPNLFHIFHSSRFESRKYVTAFAFIVLVLPSTDWNRFGSPHLACARRGTPSYHLLTASIRVYNTFTPIYVSSLTSCVLISRGWCRSLYRTYALA